MTTSPNLNVFTGPDALKDYFDPDKAPPVPLVELPECLNPHRNHGVRIYAKMMSQHPANNVKAMPAMNLLEGCVTDKTKTVIEYSSGSTVISMAMVSRIYHNIGDVRAYLSNKTSQAKLRLMQFFGLDITLFGGPSQPEPLDARGGIQRARTTAAESDAVINPNQYENDLNWQSHIRWTGPQILKQLPQINVICAGMGTSGTMTGLGTFFKQAKPSVTRLAVCTAPGDRVPGPRSYALLAPVEFPWKEAVDQVEEVGSYDSYSLSLDLCRNGLVCGPSSGFNLQGLYNFIEKRHKSNTLDDLRGADGEIHCVFMCCDLPYQYIDDYFSKLSSHRFPQINNEALTKVDLYRYDEAWEISGPDAARIFLSIATNSISPKEGTAIIDLRQALDFDLWHLPEASNVPLKSLQSDTASPFFVADILERQWIELETLFQQRPEIAQLEGHKVLLLCYSGDTARVATSILRARKIEAVCVRGGLQALLQDLPTLQTHVDPIVASTKESSRKASCQNTAFVNLRELHLPVDE